MNKRRKERKRYLLLIAATTTALAAMMACQYAAQARIPAVQTTVLERRDVRQTVVCSGTVAATDGVEVYAQMPCVAGNVKVQVGDRVEKGDVLMDVDRTATLALAVSAGLSEGQTGMAAAALPDEIASPVQGVVSAVNVRQGETLGTASPCVVLSSGGGVQISLPIRESMLPHIAVGQEVSVSGVAFEKEVYHGTVSAIASSARTKVSGSSTQTVVDAVVSLSPEEVDGSLLIGLSAKATVTVGQRENVLLMPYDCLIRTKDGQDAVYLLKGNVACLQVVELGEEYADGAEVLSGVGEGDTVVTNPEDLGGDTAVVETEAT